MPTRTAAAKGSKSTASKTTVKQAGTKTAGKPSQRTRKPSGSSANKQARKAASKPKTVSELVFTADVAKMPSGSGGIRYGEQEADGRDFLVFGAPYMTQEAFAALGLKEGDSIEVTVKKA